MEIISSSRMDAVMFQLRLSCSCAELTSATVLSVAAVPQFCVDLVAYFVNVELESSPAVAEPLYETSGSPSASSVDAANGFDVAADPPPNGFESSPSESSLRTGVVSTASFPVLFLALRRT